MTLHQIPTAAVCGCDDIARGLMTVDAALRRGLALCTAVAETETLPLDAATGRVLVAPATAPLPLPPFDSAAMDGYALRRADLVGPGPWHLPVAGRIAAGMAAPARMPAGAGLRIFTGAPVPPDCDAVVMQERVTRSGDTLRLDRMPAPGENIRRAGEDLAAGAAILPAGRVVGAREAAALRAALERAAATADLVVSTGGVSVGEEDHMPRLLRAAGGEIAVLKVAMKPGKPVALGRLGGAVYIGLPGNPVSAFVTWAVLGARMAEALAGIADPTTRRQIVRAIAPLTRRPGRCEFRPVRLPARHIRHRHPVAECLQHNRGLHMLRPPPPSGRTRHNIDTPGISFGADVRSYASLYIVIHRRLHRDGRHLGRGVPSSNEGGQPPLTFLGQCAWRGNALEDALLRLDEREDEPAYGAALFFRPLGPELPEARAPLADRDLERLFDHRKPGLRIVRATAAVTGSDVAARLLAAVRLWLPERDLTPGKGERRSRPGRPIDPDGVRRSAAR